jgi:ribosomal protein S18 acetylase RimI-like enzyme
VQDQIAAYCWFSQTPECIGEMEREIQISAGEAYVWDCATLPAFRRKNLYKALLGHLTLFLKAEGLRRVWIGSSLDNHPSQRAFKRAGFQPVVTAVYVRLYNLGCMVIIGTPPAPPDLVAAARRRLALSQELSWGPFLLSFSRRVQRPACVQA